MLYSLNIQLYHLRLIPARMLPTLDHYLPRPPIPVEVFLMALVSAVTGTAKQLKVRYPPLMLFRLLMVIIIVGSSTHLSSQQ